MNTRPDLQWKARKPVNTLYETVNAGLLDRDVVGHIVRGASLCNFVTAAAAVGAEIISSARRAGPFHDFGHARQYVLHVIGLARNS